MEFARPYALLLALLAAPLLGLLFVPTKRGIATPSSGALTRLRPTWRLRCARVLPLARVVGVVLITAGVILVSAS